jgi:TfoX/Sxy family transcriptional regulator of competence genes
MAYDEGLAERIRDALDGERGITEKKMFGGVAFLLRGKMFVGIVKNDLMVRVGADGYQAALERPFARPMDFTGKPMAGYVYVAPDGTEEDRTLLDWVRRGLKFASTLTDGDPKPARRRRR